MEQRKPIMLMLLGCVPRWIQMGSLFRGVCVITYQSFVTFLMKPGGADVCCLILFMSGLFSLSLKELKTEKNSFTSPTVWRTTRVTEIALNAFL